MNVFIAYFKTRKNVYPITGNVGLVKNILFVTFPPSGAFFIISAVAGGFSYFFTFLI